MQAEKDSLDAKPRPRMIPFRLLANCGVALALALVLVAGLLSNLHAAAPAQTSSPTARGGVITDGDIVSVEKRAELPDGATVARPADLLTYTVVITNNDPSTLASILVTDTPSPYVSYVLSSTELDEGSGFAPVNDNAEPPYLPPATGLVLNDLETNETITLRYRMQVTDTLPAGVDGLVNRVDVLALDDVVSATLAFPALGNPELTLEKRAAMSLATSAPGVLVRAGEGISWTYSVTNSGALSLTAITLADSDPAVTPTLSLGDLPDVLAPGEGLLYVADGIAQAGQYSNTATVTGVVTDTQADAAGTGDGPGVARSGLALAANHTATVTATATSYYFGIAPALTLSKTTTPTTFTETTTVSYTYRLRNSGNISLTNVAVADDRCAPVLLPGSSPQPDGGLTLAVSETVQLACSTLISATTRNVATATAIDPLGGPITATAVATVTRQQAGLDLVMQPSAAVVSAGSPVTYSYTVSNTGDLTVTALMLTDDGCAAVTVAPGSEDALNLGLGAGAQAQFTCSTLITAPVTNTATVSGLDPFSNTVTATATASVEVATVGIELVKHVSDATVRAGALVTYTYAVTNTGTVSWSQVIVEDDRCGPVNGDGAGDIGPNARRTFTCTTVLAADTTNVATATATLIPTGPISGVITATAQAFVDVAMYWMPILEKGPLTPADCPLPDGCAIPGAADVKALAYHSELDRLYVLSQAAEQVIMLDAVTFEVLGQVATGGEPWGMVLNETANRLFVSNFVSGTVSVYDATTLAFVEDLAVAGNPGEMAVVPARNMLLVLTRPDSRVLVFEGSTQVQDISAGGSGPYDIVVDAVRDLVYISHRDSGSLSLLEWLDDAWTPLPGPQFDDDRQYFAVDWNPNTERLYVLTADSESQWRLEVWQPSVTPPWSRLTAPAIPSGGDIATAQVGGAGLLVNPATGQIYTANTGDGSISRVEGVNDILVETVPTGDDPYVLALDPATNTIFVGLRAAGQVAKLDGNVD